MKIHEIRLKTQENLPAAVAAGFKPHEIYRSFFQDFDADSIVKLGDDEKAAHLQTWCCRAGLLVDDDETRCSYSRRSTWPERLLSAGWAFWKSACEPAMETELCAPRHPDDFVWPLMIGVALMLPTAN